MSAGIRKGALTWLAAGLLAAAQAAHAAGFDVAALMELLKTHKAGRATFHETKEIAILDRPVESSGELTFTPPDRLEKRSVGLNAERLVADRDTLTVEGSGRKQTLSLREHPQVAVFIESIRGTLAGDRAALDKTYELALAGSPERWRLTLTPRDAALRRIVARIEIGGAGNEVRRVEIQQADGDRSLMTITPAAP